MPTIGYATLQIIPSLQGVTDAIEKQIDGKVVSLKIQPKVDQPAAEKAGKQTRQTVEKHTQEIKVAPKVDTKAAEEAGKKAGKTVNDEIASSAKSSAGKEAAKAIVDGIADGVKKELPRGRVGEAIVDGIAEGVKQGIDGVGIGGQVVDTIGTGIRSGNLGGTLKDSIIPAIKGIGDELRSGAATWAGGIADSLRSGDIQGATNEISTTVRNTTDLIAEIGTTFGLQLDGVRVFGDEAATTLSQFGTNIQGVITTATGINDTFNTAGDLLEKVLPGKAGAGAAGIARALGSVAVPAWLLYLVAQDRSGRTWGNGDPVSAIPSPSDFTPGQRSTNEILYGPYIGPWLDKTLGITPPPASLQPIFGDQGPTGKTQRERRGYGTGGYTGSMPVDKIAGVVHGGEYVINAPSTKNLENAYPGLLSYLNNQGDLPFGQGNFNPGILIDTSNVSADEPRPSKSSGLAGGGGWFGDPSTNRFNLPGYKGGGKVELGNISGPGITTAEQQSMWDAVRGRFPNAVLSSATRTVMTEGHPDFHNSGRAIDISGPGMGSIASWIASTYPDSLELIHSPFGHNIKNGRDVGDGNAFYGAGLMAAHRNHVHWALGKTASTPTTSLAAPSAPAAAEAAANSGAATITPTAASNSGGISLAGSLSGLAAMGGEQIGKIPAPITSPDGKTQSLENIGSAVGQVAAGQVSSALGVLGINDAPGWLKGASQLINGIKIGGPLGGDASPAAANVAPMSSAITPAINAATDVVGGIVGGQLAAPVSQTTFNIQTTDIEPAYLASQRLEKERAAANLARF